jgi:hypothetical protein
MPCQPLTVQLDHESRNQYHGNNNSNPTNQSAAYPKEENPHLSHSTNSAHNNDHIVEITEKERLLHQYATGP